MRWTASKHACCERVCGPAQARCSAGPLRYRRRRGPAEGGPGTSRAAAAVRAAAAAEAEGGSQPAAPAALASPESGDLPLRGPAEEGAPPDLPDPDFIFEERNFLAEAPELRAFFTEKIVLDNLRATGWVPASREAVAPWSAWDTLLGGEGGAPAAETYSIPVRTPAKAFFPRSLYRPLKAALQRYGEERLGCRGVSAPYLSYYLAGCQHPWHCSSPQGNFAFLLSLTDWEGRGFDGGETMLLQPNVLATDETALIDPVFNSLLVYDSRVPMGVRQVQGTLDPVDSRIVIHGWFSSPAPFFTGPLTEEQAGPALRAGLATLHRALGALSHSAAGCVVLRLRVAGDTGRVTGLRWLVNTFIADPWPGKQSWVVVDDILRLVEVHARAWRFPSSGGGDSHLTLPITLPEPAPTL